MGDDLRMMSLMVWDGDSIWILFSLVKKSCSIVLFWLLLRHRLVFI